MTMNPTNASPALLKAIAVTAELCGRQFTPEAARVFAQDLASYPEAAVMGALVRCRREVKGMLSTQDVFSRIDDGRPGPEEAWAMVPLHEWQSVVWTAEMAEAFNVCHHLIATDKVAARMAFKEAYVREVQKARDARRTVSWMPSLGHDAQHRERVLNEAITVGRLCLEDARAALPALPAPERPGDTIQHEGPPEQVLKIAEDLRARQSKVDPLAWARELRAAERGGLQLSEAKRAAWRHALGTAAAAETLKGVFKGIPEDALPPGMRKARARETPTENSPAAIEHGHSIE